MNFPAGLKMGEMLVQVTPTPPDICYLQPPYDRETSVTFTARARSMSATVCYKLLAFKSNKLSVRVDKPKVIVEGKETWPNPNRIELQDDSGMLEPGETREFKVTLESGYDPSVSTDNGFIIIFGYAPAALAEGQPNWWKDQTFRGDYCKSIEIEFEMKPPLGMLEDPHNTDKSFDRVLSSLGQAPQLHVCELVEGATAEEGNHSCPTCQEHQKEIVIDDLVEKLKVCEENMEKLLAASVRALERAQAKGLLNENFERQ